MLWIALVSGYLLVALVVMGYISEAIAEWPNEPIALMGLVWLPFLIMYGPYWLGKQLPQVPRLVRAYRARRAEIARRLRACNACGEPHNPNEECEEDALMKRNG